jgi:hypothetical protein
MDPAPRVSDRVVAGLVAVALLLGIGLYNAFDWSSGAPAATQPAALQPTTTTAPTAGSTGGSVGGAGSSAIGGSGGVFGSGSQALADGVEAGAGAGTVDVPETPQPPDVPNPVCPTSVASDAYEQVVDAVSAATGRPLPRDNVRLLAEIGAGCSNESAATPVIGLALDLSRVLPDTALEPVDLSAVPSVEAPALPPEVIDSLGPIADPIGEGCATVGLLGVLVAVVPGAAHVPVHGSDLATALVPAQSLCAQFER